MAKSRNTFQGGMDQDTSKSKYDNTHYYSLTNGKILTEEGLSSGSLENEDGNLLSFSLPDTYGFWKIRFNTPEEPTSGTLDINYNSSVNNTGNVSNIEDLYAAMLVALSGLSSTDYKLVRNGEFIYLIPLTSALTFIFGREGLSDNNGLFEVEPQTGLKIIGWTTLREEVILFTTNDTSTAPSSAGQIWKFSYDPITKIINNIGSNSTLTLSSHLIYNNMLNFSTHWHIGTEAEGHYENSKTGRVYWTDEYNNLRTVNALDPNLLGLSVGDLTINASAAMTMPVLDKVTTGGSLPNGATMQYAYRLFNAGGGTTVFSPVTNPIPLGDFDPLSDTAGNRPWEADGDTKSTGSKSVHYSIRGIDTSYNYIQHIAIQTGNSSSIYMFQEEAVPSDGNLDVVHTDTGDNIPVTKEEFAFLTRTFKRCKTITIKDKRLIAANLDTLDTTLDGWESRAYRFNSVANGKTSLLVDKELSNVTLSAATSPPDYTLVPDEHDAINDYNLEEHLASDGVVNTANQYKFKEDGVTLGGSGLNVSYEFTTQAITLKATVSGAGSNGYAKDGNYNTIHYNRYRSAPYSNSSPIQLNGEDRVGPEEYQSFMSPAVTNTFKGYARGETYRFGIAFYDMSGNPYNTKWIGDIKIPEATEAVGGAYPYRVTTADIAVGNIANGNNPIQGNSIGVQFTIDTSSLLGVVSGYEIVRVKRESQDKTRMGTGVMTNFGLVNGTNYPGRRYKTQTNGFFAAGGVPTGFSVTNFADSDQVEVQGTSSAPTAIINDAPVFSYTSGLKTMAIISPTTIVRKSSKYSYKTGDTVRTLGFYKDLYEAGTIYQKRNADDHNGDPDKLVAGYNVLGREWTTNTNCQETRVIEREEQVEMGSVLTSGSWSGPGDLNANFINASPSTNGEKDPAGVGGQKQVINIPSKFQYYNPNAVVGNSGTSPGMLQREALADSVTNPIVGAVKSYWWREISYDRVIAKQYGGNTYESRSGNEYISTGTFEPLKEYSIGSRTMIAYGGDVFVSMFHYQFFEQNYGSLNQGNFEVNDYKYHLGFAMPCETPINCDYLDAGHYASENDTNWLKGVGSQSSVGEAVYNLGKHYSFENEIKKIFYPKDFIDNNVEEHPHRIWASEPKIDGELLDSWRVWLTNNYTEVEGQYGQINKITTIRDSFLFYQDRAFGTASINDRSVINDENGVALTVGSGGILDDFGYISRNTGTRQKFSVVPTGEAVHHFDGVLKKWFRYGQGAKPLSDVEGLHSHLLSYDGNLLASDRILEGSGVHGVFDKVRNKVYMTFLGAHSSAALPGSDVAPSTEEENFTITYNEALRAYDEFSNCSPSLWLETEGKVLAVARDDETVGTVDPRNKGYLQYEGDKNKFFETVYPTIIEMILVPNADTTNVFDTVSYKSEISINGVDMPNLTWDSIQVVNDHQDSGVITLVPDSNAQRRFRSWRLNIPRDASSPNGDARMRDYFIKVIYS